MIEYNISWRFNKVWLNFFHRKCPKKEKQTFLELLYTFFGHTLKNLQIFTCNMSIERSWHVGFRIFIKYEKYWKLAFTVQNFKKRKKLQKKQKWFLVSKKANFQYFTKMIIVLFSPWKKPFKRHITCNNRIIFTVFEKMHFVAQKGAFLSFFHLCGWKKLIKPYWILMKYYILS